eukprot:588794-Rhodomonas_salina.1
MTGWAHPPSLQALPVPPASFPVICFRGEQPSMLLRVLSVRLLVWPVLPSIPFGFWCNAQHHQCCRIQQCCQRSSTENGSR